MERPEASDCPVLSDQADTQPADTTWSNIEQRATQSSDGQPSDIEPSDIQPTSTLHGGSSHDIQQGIILPADILIVDDVVENVRLLSSMLEQYGFPTRKVTSGAMALTAVEAVPPSLILLDVRMAGMSGYEVCQQLKANSQTAHIPIIFLSAADDVESKVLAFQVGGADYITKPFHIEEVLARVQHQLTLIAAQQTIRQLNAELEERVKKRTHQLELANAQLAQMAYHDSLTELPNRPFLMNQIWQALEQQRLDPQYRFAILYLDCDRFKIVNDSLGHQAGDELLLAIAQRLKAILRQDDVLARLGGDEFVALLPQLSDPQTPMQVAARILAHFTTPFCCRNRDIFISLSIGIVTDGSTYHDPEELLRDADIAMYQAKAAGKDRYQIFSPSMHQALYQRLQIETDLRKAVQQQDLTLHYQPIVNLTAGEVVGAEALTRWQHPVQGAISPLVFIPIAEETGLILKLGSWALKEACRQLRQWRLEGTVSPSFFVSVNVSAYQFAQPDLVQQIDDVLVETGLPPQCLKLEITETVIMQNVTSVANIICQLRERCIQLSIDDFGTGYSSLSYLHSFPVDNLKIDRSFVERLHQPNGSLDLIKAIIQIVKTMGMSVIAEGIETPEQLGQLQALGCEAGQGFLFAKPLPPQDLVTFLAASAPLNCCRNGR